MLLFCNESLTEEIDVSFLSAEFLGNFLPIFKCSLDTLYDFFCLFNCIAGGDELSILRRESLRRNLRWDSEIMYLLSPHFPRFSHRARVRVNVVFPAHIIYLEEPGKPWATGKCV